MTPWLHFRMRAFSAMRLYLSLPPPHRVNRRMRLSTQTLNPAANEPSSLRSLATALVSVCLSASVNSQPTVLWLHCCTPYQLLLLNKSHPASAIGAIANAFLQRQLTSSASPSHLPACRELNPTGFLVMNPLNEVLI